MAKVEAWFAQDLKKPVPVRYLDGSFFNEDAAGSRIGVEVYSNGSAVTLAGSITGYCVRADGTTVPISGTRSSNRAYIDIPQSALAVPGPLTVTIKNTESSVITTLCAVVGIVTQSRTGTQVDPGQTITDWTNQISAQLQACQTAADNLGSTLAVPYASLTFPVSVGTYTMYNGNLWRAIVNIPTSEEWTIDHWLHVNVSSEMRAYDRSANYGIEQLKNAVATFTGNLVNPDDVVSGYMTVNGVAQSSSYRSTGLIRVPVNGTYVRYIPYPSSLGNSKNNIYVQRLDNPNRYDIMEGTPIDSDSYWVTFDLSGYAGRYVRFTTGAGSGYMYMGVGNQSLSPIPEYGFELDNSGTIGYGQIRDLPNFALADDVRRDLDGAVSDLATFTSNLVNPNKLTDGYMSIDGIVSNSSYVTTDLIKITQGGSYVKYVSTPGQLGAAKAQLFAQLEDNPSKYEIIEGTALDAGAYWVSFDLTNYVGRYVRFSNYKSLSVMYFGVGNSVLTPIPAYGFMIPEYGSINRTQVEGLDAYTDYKISRFFDVSPNLVNPAEIENGYMNNYGVVPSSGYRSTGLIDIMYATKYVKYVSTPGGLGSSKDKIFIQRVNQPDIYDVIVGEQVVEGSDLWYVFDMSSYVGRKIRFSNGAPSPDMYFGVGETVVSPIPEYGVALGEEVSVDYSQIKNAPTPQNYDYKSSLTGKVWYALGDSATHGDGAIPLDSGIYAGQLGVYPFYIGNRTGMVVHNLAVNGAVIATIPDQPNRYQWSVDGHYDSVGSDADYITMWIGANDMWQSVPIGTIDSTDPTTFYGAYNKVLTYYVNNFPKAKLGIVASFWCTAEYANAVIAIGAKYGIPVLNLYNDPNRPVTVGSKRPDVSSAIRTIRNNQWVVSSSNSHPSSEYHEIESYFIEDWLKTL